MIVVDSSAVVAILFGEPWAAALSTCLASDTDRLMSVASYLETGTVLAGRRRSDRSLAVDDLDRFLDEAGIRLAPVDEAQARIALRARIAYGRGMGHGGVLNFGDVFPMHWPRCLWPLCCSLVMISAQPISYRRWISTKPTDDAPRFAGSRAKSFAGQRLGPDQFGFIGPPRG